jgi:2-oxoisovalerate dehydrogenase E2 component (dihydrolipoyl transacylase)
VLAAPGDVVPVGQPIIRIEDGVQAAPSPSAEGEGGAAAAAEAPSGQGAQGLDPTAEAGGATAAPPGEGQRTAVLVGYGVKAEQTPLRRPRRTPHGADHVEPGPPGERGRPVRQGGLELGRALETRLGSDQVRAKPPVRRLARDLDVDLSQVVPTGPDATITHDDVSRAAAAARGPVSPGRVVPTAPVARAADGGGSEVVPLTHVGRMMAHAMTSSAFTAVHVTEWVDVDVTAMTSLIRAARAREDMAGLSITPLTFAALGLVRAARDHPTVNSSLDETSENLLVHRSVHLGIAVDSPRGLIVPRIADAQDLDLRGMGDALARLIETARAGRSRPEDLRGSTITITNVGVFGVDGGTPILNPGEVAILALGRVLPRPWAVDGRVEVRDVVTLALSFDHRVVDGAMGSRVLREVADFMSDPGTALTLG